MCMTSFSLCLFLSLLDSDTSPGQAGFRFRQQDQRDLNTEKEAVDMLEMMLLYVMPSLLEAFGVKGVKLPLLTCFQMQGFAAVQKR